MMESLSGIAYRQISVAAGASLLVMALIAGVAYGYLYPAIYLPDDVNQTLYQLQNWPSGLRLLVFFFTIILLLDVLVAWLLDLFFRPFNSALSRLSAWLRLMYAAILGVALLPLIGIFSIPNRVPFSADFCSNQFETFQHVWSMGLLIFGFHLGVVTWLMHKHKNIPKYLSFLMLLASICYVLTNSASMLLINYALYRPMVDQILALPMALGELSLAVWLIWKGGKTNEAVPV